MPPLANILALTSPRNSDYVLLVSFAYHGNIIKRSGNNRDSKGEAL